VVLPKIIRRRFQINHRVGLHGVVGSLPIHPGGVSDSPRSRLHPSLLLLDNTYIRIFGVSGHSGRVLETKTFPRRDRDNVSHSGVNMS